MSNAIYATLTRQQGLMQELQLVANNLANANTTGFKADRALFTEFLMPAGEGQPSLSMGGLGAHAFELSQGAVRVTGGPFDLAIEGEGYFIVDTGAGQRLTRSGSFLPSPEGVLVDANGYRVLSAGGGPITLPAGAGQVAISADGTISADGQLVDRIGVGLPSGMLERDTGTLFRAPAGFVPSETPSVVQGALEQSNVAPVLEVARMIAVQRAYEAGQALLDGEDRRIGQLITSLRER